MNLFKYIDDDYNYLLSMAGDTVLVNDIFPIKAMINNLPVNRNNAFNDLRKISSVSELTRGDSISWNNEEWLIISEIAGKRFNHYKGIIQRCNYNIKFIFSDGIIREFPVILDSRVYDTETNQFITVPTGKVIVTMQNNEYSRKIKANQRFIKMDNAYKVIGKDLTKNGLIILYCDLDVIKSNDDVENEVANGNDYVLTLTITNGDTASINVGDNLQLNISLKLNDEDVTDKEISFTSSNPEVATVNESGLITGTGEGECSITAYLKEMPNIKDTITLSVEDLPQDNFTYELIGAADITKGYSQTYTAKKYNNLVLVEDAEFEFTIIPGSTPTSAYSLQVISDNECKITANANTHYITLRATDRADESKFVEKSIRLKSLF